MEAGSEPYWVVEEVEVVAVDAAAAEVVGEEVVVMVVAVAVAVAVAGEFVVGCGYDYGYGKDNVHDWDNENKLHCVHSYSYYGSDSVKGCEHVHVSSSVISVKRTSCTPHSCMVSLLYEYVGAYSGVSAG